MFDLEQFVRDVHAFRRRQGHSIGDVAKIVGRSPGNMSEFFRNFRTNRIWLSTVLLLADYADLSIDHYRGTNAKPKTTRQRAPRLERSRTKSGYPILRSTHTGRAV